MRIYDAQSTSFEIAQAGAHVGDITFETLEETAIVVSSDDEVICFTGTPEQLIDFVSRLRLALVDGIVEVVRQSAPESTISRTVNINLDDYALAAALIDFTFDGDVIAAEESDDQTIEDKLHLAAEDMQLDGLIAYATDFVIGTDLDEWHVVWSHRIPEIEDTAALEVRMLRGIGGYYVEHVPDIHNTDRPLDWVICETAVDGEIVERFATERDAYEALPRVAAQKGQQ